MGLHCLEKYLGHVTIALLCVVPATGVPAFDVNLDLHPRQRWAQVATYWKKTIVGLIEEMVPAANTQADHNKWVQTVPFDPELQEELEGIAATINHPSVSVERLKWMNMLYEMDSPYKFGCADVLWAMHNGTVVFGRNLDFMPGEYSRSRWRDWPSMTYEVTMHKGGRPLMKITQMPGEVGMHTGMRFNSEGGLGWAFAQNTRKGNHWKDNLDAATRYGAEMFMPRVRRIMETVPDFNNAVQMLYTTKWAAPQYFVVSGGGPYEGAVLTIDRNAQHLSSSPPIIRVGNNGNDWHLVQTNDDLLGIPSDSRRSQANAILSQYSQEVTLNHDNMFGLLHSGDTSSPISETVLNDGTVFTSVMVPATGYYRTILPTESAKTPVNLASYGNYANVQPYGGAGGGGYGGGYGGGAGGGYGAMNMNSLGPDAGGYGGGYGLAGYGGGGYGGGGMNTNALGMDGMGGGGYGGGGYGGDMNMNFGGMDEDSMEDAYGFLQIGSETKKVPADSPSRKNLRTPKGLKIRKAAKKNVPMLHDDAVSFMQTSLEL